LVSAQQAAYSVAGVDESVSYPASSPSLGSSQSRSPRHHHRSQAPVAGAVARESKKRKQQEQDTAEPDGSGGVKHNKKGKQRESNNKPPPARQTAVWVSQLPQSATQHQLKQVFSKAGLILEDAEGDPRIKLYYDDHQNFKGDALIVYLQAESVELAVRLFDDTELVLGSGEGNMSVKKAEWDKKKAAESSSGDGGDDATRPPPSRQSEQDKQRAKKRAANLKK